MSVLRSSLLLSLTLLILSCGRNQFYYGSSVFFYINYTYFFSRSCSFYREYIVHSLHDLKNTTQKWFRKIVELPLQCASLFKFYEHVSYFKELPFVLKCIYRANVLIMSRNCKFPPFYE